MLSHVFYFEFKNIYHIFKFLFSLFCLYQTHRLMTLDIIICIWLSLCLSQIHEVMTVCTYVPPPPPPPGGMDPMYQYFSAASGPDQQLSTYEIQRVLNSMNWTQFSVTTCEMMGGKYFTIGVKSHFVSYLCGRTFKYNLGGRPSWLLCMKSMRREGVGGGGSAYVILHFYTFVGKNVQLD